MKTTGVPRALSRFSRSSLVPFVLLFLLLSPASIGQTIWTGAASDGSWFTASNWSTGTLPNSNTHVSIPAGQTVSVAGATAAVGQMTFGDGPGTGNLIVDTGGILDVSFDLFPNSTAGSGSILVRNGGRLTIQLGEIGSAANQPMTATVTGSGSTWTSTAGFSVGNDTGSNGQLTVTNSGKLIANALSSIGTMGTGSLTISAGGNATFTDAYVGAMSGAQGSVLLTGSTSRWTLSGGLYLGYQDSGTQGTVTVEQGAQGTSNRVVLGYLGGTQGTMTLRDAGTAWTTTAEMTVGSSGTGTLLVSNGASLTTGGTNSYIGYDNVGVATVTGAGSVWTNSATTSLGWGGDGTLNVTAGGVANFASLYVGGYYSGTGTVTVSGTGSQLNTTALTVGDSGGSGSLTVADGGTVKVGASGTAALSIVSTGAVNLGAGATAGTLLAGSIANDGVLTFNHANDVAFAIAISGNGSLTKAGTGTLTLSGSSYTGTTTVTGGTLKLGTATALQGTAVLLAGGALDLNGFTATLGGLGGTGNVAFSGSALTVGGAGVATTFAGSLSGSGGLVKTGNSTLALSGINTYGGNTTISGGALRLDTTAALPATSNVTLNGGVLEFGASVPATVTVGTAAGQVQWSGSGGFSVHGGDRSIAYETGAALTWGASNFVGTGNSLILSSSNSDSTTTFPNAIALAGSTATVQVNNGTAAVDAVLSGVLSGSSPLAKTGAGTLALTNTNSYGGTTTISGGLISFSSVSNFGTGNLVLNGGGVQWAAGNTYDISAKLSALGSGGATFDTNGNNVTLASILSGTGSSLIKSGAGTLTLSGINTYTGGTTLNAGTLTVSGSGRLGATTGAVTINGGTLDLAGTSQTAGIVTVSGGTLGNGTLTGTSFAVKSGTLSASLAGAAALNKTTDATVTLTGANSFTGKTTIVAGTLEVSTLANAAANSSLGAPVTANATITIGGSAAGTLRYLGAGNTTNRALALGSGDQGATLDASGTGAVVFSGGVTASGGGSKTLTLSGTNADANTLSGIIANNSSTNRTAVAKTGAGLWVLSGVNTFTGGVTVYAGTLRATTSASALGGSASTLTLSGGTLELANATGLSFGRATTVSANATIVSDVLTNGNGVTHSLGTLWMEAPTLTVSAGSHVTGTTAGLTFGATTLASDATFAVGANAQLTLGALSSDGYVATLTKTGAGTLLLGTAASSSNWVVGNNLVINQGVAQLNLANALGSTAKTNVVVNATTAGSTAAFNLNNVNQSVLSLTFGGAGGTSTSTNNVSTGTGTLTLGGNVSYLATGNPLGSTLAGKLALGTGAREFNIADSNQAAADLTISAVISGSGSTRKTGAGTLLLSGANTFSGGTTISFGTVKTGHTTALGTGPVTVRGAGAVLNLANSLANSIAIDTGGMVTGSGGGGSVSIGSGGTVSPGIAIGSLAFGATTWAGNSTFTFQLDNAAGVAGTNWDSLSITGALTLSATPSSKITLGLTTLDFTTGNPGAASNFNSASNYSFAFATASGGISGFDASAFTIDSSSFANFSGGSWSVGLSGNALSLIYTGAVSAIPEPGTYALLVAFLVLAFVTWRRTRSGTQGRLR